MRAERVWGLRTREQLYVLMYYYVVLPIFDFLVIARSSSTGRFGKTERGAREEPDRPRTIGTSFSSFLDSTSRGTAPRRAAVPHGLNILHSVTLPPYRAGFPEKVHVVAEENSIRDHYPTPPRPLDSFRDVEYHPTFAGCSQWSRPSVRPGRTSGLALSRNPCLRTKLGSKAFRAPRRFYDRFEPTQVRHASAARLEG